MIKSRAFISESAVVSFFHYVAYHDYSLVLAFYSVKLAIYCAILPCTQLVHFFYFLISFVLVVQDFQTNF
jgi:hypothetical protein